MLLLLLAGWVSTCGARAAAVFVPAGEELVRRAAVAAAFGRLVEELEGGFAGAGVLERAGGTTVAGAVTVTGSVTVAVAGGGGAEDVVSLPRSRSLSVSFCTFHEHLDVLMSRLRSPDSDSTYLDIIDHITEPSVVLVAK